MSCGHISSPTYKTEFIFSDAGKFCFVHGLRQLTRDTKGDVSCLQTSFTCRKENLRMMFGVGGHTKNKEKNRAIVMKTTIFPIIGKKNNQPSVPDADREIQTLG